MKVWQYLSKWSNKWTTMKKAPTPEELVDYEKHYYQLRELIVDEKDGYKKQQL